MQVEKQVKATNILLATCAAKQNIVETVWVSLRDNELYVKQTIETYTKHLYDKTLKQK